MELPKTIEEHPYIWGVGAAVAVIVVIYLFFSGSSSSTATSTTTSGSNAAAAQAYYNAQAAAALSGNALAASGIQQQTSVNAISAALEQTTNTNATAAQIAATNANAATATNTANDAFTYNTTISNNETALGLGEEAIQSQAITGYFADLGAGVPASSLPNYYQVSNFFNPVVSAETGYGSPTAAGIAPSSVFNVNASDVISHAMQLGTGGPAPGPSGNPMPAQPKVGLPDQGFVG